MPSAEASSRIKIFEEIDARCKVIVMQLCGWVSCVVITSHLLTSIYGRKGEADEKRLNKHLGIITPHNILNPLSQYQVV